jgi:hypothetical protein
MLDTLSYKDVFETPTALQQVDPEGFRNLYTAKMMRLQGDVLRNPPGRYADKLNRPEAVYFTPEFRAKLEGLAEMQDRPAAAAPAQAPLTVEQRLNRILGI